MNTTDALILFFKYPEQGRVKTRLASSFGQAFALELYVSFLKDILAMSSSVQADKIIVTDVWGDIPAHMLDMGTGYRTMLQQGEDIGIRMFNAFLQIFDMGYQRAVLIGGDSPDLPAEFIQRALNALFSHDAALGKSTDGGYYLIGFKNETCLPQFFQGIQWSTQYVFQDTVVKMSQAGKTIYLLPEWNDIDEKDDLISFYNQKSQKQISHTIEFLDNVHALTSNGDS
ncbi:MAG: TIGR04282 family arsenosugar biosynthesis glycosyltransferase [Desulfamplus sp.]|nr:TIGR04282 family arsenosugar biosynthesis glycosyltransferase [Desulfamplus sp.]